MQVEAGGGWEGAARGGERGGGHEGRGNREGTGKEVKADGAPGIDRFSASLLCHVPER